MRDQLLRASFGFPLPRWCNRSHEFDKLLPALNSTAVPPRICSGGFQEQYLSCRLGGVGLLAAERQGLFQRRLTNRECEEAKDVDNTALPSTANTTAVSQLTHC